GTKILATVDGILRTVTESSLRRNLKLQDEEGIRISSLPDAEPFENLTLMGYNISPNQKFTFQKGQFSHQWNYLIHTIMQCLSPKRIGFNEFSSNIATALVCLATNMNYNFLKTIFDGMVKNVNNKGEGSDTPTGPHHTPSSAAQQTSSTTSSSPTLSSVTTAPIPTVTPSDTPLLRQYTRRARIAYMQQTLDELTALYTSLQRQHSEMVSKFESQELEINMLKARIKLFEDRERGGGDRSGDDAPIKGRNLVSGNAEVSTGGGSIPTVGPSAAEVPTGSDVVPTAGPIFATATVVTPYTRRKGKETMVESETPKKKKVAKDAEIARIHAEEELQIMINGLDRSNETVAKYLQGYHQFALELPLERRIEFVVC
nr:synaptobrevin, longin-like domain protein [Tanacetum cinerariifolium]